MPTIKKEQRPWIKTNPKPDNRIPNGNIPANFYRMAAWRKLRARVLDAEPFCRECMSQQIVTPAQMVDHIQPIRLGGAPMDEANLAGLCHACHQSKRGKERHMKE